jgi:acetyl-CoA C-acetyltransferase
MLLRAYFKDNAMSHEIVIVGAKRTPFGRYLGSLSEMEPLDLAVHAAQAALCAQGTDLTDQIDQIFAGNCLPGAFEAGSVTGRQIGLKLGIDKFSTTLDTACCAPLTALRMAIWGLRLGEMDSALVIGVESMSRIPHLSRQLRAGVRIGPVTLHDFIYPIGYPGYNPVAVDASDGADKHQVPKRMLDAWGTASHKKWEAAQEAGKFEEELAPIPVRKGRESFLFAVDECPRLESVLAAVQQLPPVFGANNTTAGNAPGLNDGAAAMVVMTRAKCQALGLKPLAVIVDAACRTDMPYGISWIPALTVSALLERVGAGVDEMDLIEINEAFAAMPLVSTKILAENNQDKWFALLKKTNVNGGAVAIGHPVGASGLRIVMTMLYELARRGGGLGIAAICGGLTQGEAVLIKV